MKKNFFKSIVKTRLIASLPLLRRGLGGGLFPVLLIALAMAVGCDKEEKDATVAVTGITVSPTTKTLDVGGTFTFTVAVTPDDASDKSVTWTSSSTVTATVSATGLVTAGTTEGTATITATANDGSGKKGTATVTVTADDDPDPDPVAVTSVAINEAAQTLTVGGTFTFTATVMPDDATNKSVTWSSNDQDVATVDATSGLVTAGTTEGPATITVTTVDGSKTASVAVTVELSPAQKAAALATALENATAEGATVTLTGNVTAANVTVPAGVTLAVPSGDTLTVTGTLSGAGTLTVAGVADVTTSNFTGAVDLQNGGATNVGFTAPSGAASGLVWKFGSQTWSDLIQLPACDGQFTPNVTTAAGGTFTHNETKRFVYNWYYVNENAGTLCPEGWRVPTKADADALVSAAGQASFLTDRWGYGGQLNYAGDKDMADVALLYWTSTENNDNEAWDLTAVPEWTMFLTNSNPKYLGKQVRCVRE